MWGKLSSASLIHCDATMAACRSSQSCCVPYCTNSKKKQPYLSFHSFPTDESLRKKWILSIRREEGPEFTVRRGSTFVCAMHFEGSDVLVHVDSGRKYLRAQAVPSRFAWNNFAEKKTQSGTAKKSFYVDRPAALLIKEHDYNCRPPPGALDEALERIQELEEKALGITLSEPKIHRWCVSDEDFKFFTRFSSKHIFLAFWRSIEPAASRTACWTKAGRVWVDTKEGDYLNASLSRQLHMIDEFFMFCLRVAAGFPESILAGMFGVSTYTVTRIIIFWSDYLFIVLGSIPIWMTREQVTRTMPEKVRQCSPSVRVIVACTELRCESPESVNLRCETQTTHKSYNTLKVLVGAAPCGALTFASRLFSSSISDEEVIKQSGILELLEPGDEVIAEEGFPIEKLLEDVGAKLYKHKFHLSQDETDKAQVMAGLRMPVECVIRRVKDYHIWDTPLPLSLAGTLHQLWASCCLLANSQGPLDHRFDEDFWAG